MIQTFFNGMIALLLAKFVFNDLPHSAGLLANPYVERPPTPGQLRYIASLCQRLGIRTPYEEEVKTFGEAGRMIRELEEEERYRKMQKRLSKGSSNPYRIPTKEEIGLGVLYHGTTSTRANIILNEGLKLSENGIVWLAYSYSDALGRAEEASLEERGSPAVLEVDLPGNWHLERAESGVYLSHDVIPKRYIKRLKGST